MSRIFLTGDIHGEIQISRLSSKKFPEGTSLSKDDFVIILGDFGLVWDGQNAASRKKKPKAAKGELQTVQEPATDFWAASDTEKYWLDWLSKKPWTTLFLDGNHENFDRLFAYPGEIFHGGRAARIWDCVWYLKRGEVFTLAGMNFLAFGGAVSTDKHLRVEGRSWWSQEMPSEEDFHNALENLAAHYNYVDYVLTHTCPNSLRHRMPAVPGHGYCVGDEVGAMLDDLIGIVRFRHWYFGHYHINYDLDAKTTCLDSEKREL